jgi:ABC-type uncharacterized transport system permease subunit
VALMVGQVLPLLAGILALAIAATVARLPAKPWQGLLFGVAAGAFAQLVFGFAISFLEAVLPLAQVDFWLARRMPWLLR